MKIQSGQNNTPSFQSKYKIDLKNYEKGTQHLKKLEQYLSILGENKPLLKQDLTKNRLLVTTGKDSIKLSNEIETLHNREKYPENFKEIRSQLLDKYFDSAIEFGEKQISKIENDLSKKLNQPESNPFFKLLSFFRKDK